MVPLNVNTCKTSSLHLLQYRNEILAPWHNHRLTLTLQVLHSAARILLRLSTYLVHIHIHIRRGRLQHRSPKLVEGMRRTPLTGDDNNTSSFARRKRVDLVAKTKSFGAMSHSPDKGVATCLLRFVPSAFECRFQDIAPEYLGGRVSNCPSDTKKYCKIEHGWQNSVKRGRFSGVTLGRQWLVP